MAPRKKKKPKPLAVGDRFISDHGRAVEITDIDPEKLQLHVTVERTVVTRDGERKTDTRERIVDKENWSTFIQSYTRET